MASDGEPVNGRGSSHHHSRHHSRHGHQRDHIHSHEHHRHEQPEYEPYRPPTDGVLNLVIRRHMPGATDPVSHQLPRHPPRHLRPAPRSPSPPPPPPPKPRVRIRTPTPSPPPPVMILLPQSPTPPPSPPPQTAASPKHDIRVSHNPSPRVVPRQSQSPKSVDPDERPIVPMRDTSVYRRSSPAPPPIRNTPVRPKKPISPPKPIQPVPVSPPRYEPEPTPATTPRARVQQQPERRPVRLDMIPKRAGPPASQRPRTRPVIVEEYEDYYPEPTVRVKPKDVIQYRVVPKFSRRGLDNYEEVTPRRVVRVQGAPRRKIIYRS